MTEDMIEIELENEEEGKSVSLRLEMEGHYDIDERVIINAKKELRTIMSWILRKMKVKEEYSWL